MNESIFTAIDIGTELIKIVSVTYNHQSSKINTLLKSVSPSKGLSAGYIVNISEAEQSLQKAIFQHQKKLDFEITNVFFSINSISIKSKRLKISHSTAGSQISNFDLTKIKEKIDLLIRKKISNYILFSQPVKYIINGFDYYSPPLDLEARKIYTDYFLVSIQKNHLTSLENVIENNSIIPQDINIGILATSEVVATSEERKNGCLIINIGAETTSLAVYKNNKPIYLNVFSFGSKEFSLEISEKEKISFLEADQKKKNVNLSSTAKIAIDKKIKTIATEIKKYLKDNLELDEKPTAGVILTGGGSNLKGIEKIFKQVLLLPVRQNKTSMFLDKNTDFSTAYGLIISGLKKEKEKTSFSFMTFAKSFQKLFKKIIQKMSV